MLRGNFSNVRPWFRLFRCARGNGRPVQLAIRRGPRIRSMGAEAILMRSDSGRKPSRSAVPKGGEARMTKARTVVVAILLFLILGAGTHCVIHSHDDDDDKPPSQQQQAP